MSKIALAPNVSGTGTLTIAAPNTNSDYTLTLPTATSTLIYGTQPAGTIVGTTDTQTLTNKTLTSPTLTTPNIDSAQISTVSGSAPLYLCRAWVNFNGTGTVAIRASGNVTSITDNGVGNYTVNFTTAMTDANYAVVVTGQETSAGNRDGFYSIRFGGTYTTSAAQIFGGVLNAYNVVDNPIVNVAIFR